MNQKFRSLIKNLDLNPPINKKDIGKVETQLGTKFPDDYFEFMCSSNGAEGSVGESYLVLWAVSNLIELNEAYGVDDFAKGLILFGSNGGDTAFAFDGRYKNLTIVAVPFIGMSLEEVSICTDTFYKFLEFVSKLE